MVVCKGGRCHWVDPRTGQYLIWELLYDALILVCDITIPLCRNRKLGGEILCGICTRHDGRCCNDLLCRALWKTISVSRVSAL